MDGDTLATAGGRLRIHGIDAPESDQTCRRGGQAYACGEAARRALAALPGNGRLTCEALDTDRYGRRVVRCRNAGGLDIGRELVRQGWAVAFARYAEDYAAEANEARAARRGLWDGSFENPADWRARHRP
ncbi:thermonuclease family protein [Roseomonas eburnea]|uniref:Thermonuclease family protein n=1 Tax=Neoroseomonas eburnea TaxID=1346889 RepID=A0A9X9XFB6_9PROT|nr:thermonuclease family protein [Neoroseomonas eburnea]